MTGAETMSPKKFLFVCTGNSCRSVMGEKLLIKIAADKGLSWEAASAGVAAERFFQVPDHVYTVLAPLGIPKFEHVPQLVGRDLIGWSDVTLALTEEHCDHILDMYPEFTSKVHVLRTYTGLEEPNIEDPIGQSEKLYSACCAKIKEAVEAVIQKHSQSNET